MNQRKNLSKPLFSTMKGFQKKMEENDHSVDNLEKENWYIDDPWMDQKGDQYTMDEISTIVIQEQYQFCQKGKNFPSQLEGQKKNAKLISSLNSNRKDNKMTKKEQKLQIRDSIANKNGNNIEIDKQQLSQHSKQNSISCSNFLFCSHIPIPVSQPHRSSSLLQFEKEASNLDIILFKNENMVSKIQRFLTKSDYDHIAIIVKFPNNRRFILESSSKYGVGLTDFNKFCQFMNNKMKSQQTKKKKEKGSLHTGIAYRKLKINPTNIKSRQLQQKTYNFVQKVIGKKYKFSPMYLLSEKYQKQQQTYFCSELVAQCLKFCEIVDLNRPCFSYLPRDFYGKDKAQIEDIDLDQINADRLSQNTDFLEGFYENTRVIKYTT